MFQATLDGLHDKGYPDADRFIDHLAGDVPADLDAKIRYDLQLMWCKMATDTLTAGLLLHNGINPAVMCYAAPMASPLTIRTDDDVGLVSMGYQGWASVCVDRAQGVQWHSDSRYGGNMHRSDDLAGENADGVISLGHLPDSVVQGLAGRPLRDVISHPALDAMDLVIHDAVQAEFFTLIRPRGQTVLTRYDLTALLPARDRSADARHRQGARP